jgi:hypothetical protein
MDFHAAALPISNYWLTGLTTIPEERSGVNPRRVLFSPLSGFRIRSLSVRLVFKHATLQPPNGSKILLIQGVYFIWKDIAITREDVPI